MKNHSRSGKTNNSIIIAVVIIAVVLIGLFAVRKMRKSELSSTLTNMQQQTGNKTLQPTSGQKTTSPAVSQNDDRTIDARLNALDQDATDMNKPDQPINVMNE